MGTCLSAVTQISPKIAIWPRDSDHIYDSNFSMRKTLRAELDAQRIEQKSLERPCGFSWRRGNTIMYRIQDLIDSQSRFCGYTYNVRGIKIKHWAHLSRDTFYISLWEVYLSGSLCHWSLHTIIEYTLLIIGIILRFFSLATWKTDNDWACTPSAHWRKNEQIRNVETSWTDVWHLLVTKHPDMPRGSVIPPMWNRHDQEYQLNLEDISCCWKNESCCEF